MLGKMSTFISRMPDGSMADRDGLQEYLLRLGKTMNAFILRDKVNALQGAVAQLQPEMAIDPENSGFPISIRDMLYIRKDKENIEQRLEAIPEDDDLIQTAIFSIYNRTFPTEVIKQKLEKKYLSMLSGIDIPAQLSLGENLYVKEDKGGNIFKKVVERYDDGNIPRYYTIFFKVPTKSLKSIEWRPELEAVITNSLSGATSHELPFMAEKIEKIEGVQLKMIERVDIGPFYNKFTNNKEDMVKLLEDATDAEGVLSFTKYYIARTNNADIPVTGLANKWNAMFTGDDVIGQFDPVIASPPYMIMPFRLAQKVKSQKLILGEQAQIYGITTSGDFN
jgi:hypothetical protein